MCLGLPGALPVLNRRAVEFAIRAALALGCTDHPVSIFARKNYFYPDLPKGYQISQYERPLATDGALEYERRPGRSRRHHRVHLEEDAGKSLHEGFPDSDRATYLDFNRSGVPLIEIVTEPDLGRPPTPRVLQPAARDPRRHRRQRRQHGGGQPALRRERLGAAGRDRRRSAPRPRSRTSTRSATCSGARVRDRAADRAFSTAAAVEQETRLWDTRPAGRSSMRSKEEAHDYRYFPEPDLPPLEVEPRGIDEIRAALPGAAGRARRAVASTRCPSTTPAS